MGLVKTPIHGPFYMGNWGEITLISGVIGPLLITGRGPSCSKLCFMEFQDGAICCIHELFR